MNRSQIMSRVGRKNTPQEKTVRGILHSMGYRFRLNDKKLPGSPDIVLKKHKKVIFVHGCFWHGHQGCAKHRIPKTNYDYWYDKIHRNMERDAEIELKLKQMGWELLVIWQCQLNNKSELEKSLIYFMNL